MSVQNEIEIALNKQVMLLEKLVEFHLNHCTMCQLHSKIELKRVNGPSTPRPDDGWF